MATEMNYLAQVTHPGGLNLPGVGYLAGPRPAGREGATRGGTVFEIAAHEVKGIVRLARAGHVQILAFEEYRPEVDGPIVPAAAKPPKAEQDLRAAVRREVLEDLLRP